MNILLKTNRIVKLCVDYNIQKKFHKSSDKQIGKWTKTRLSEMGPTFIKIGQFISTRSDVFGEDFTNELKGLQDNVAVIPFDDLKDILDKYKSEFIFISETPIASASIGQVHLAQLNTGENVVIKIKRPNIDVEIDEDFGLLLSIINFIKLFSDDRKLIEFEILFNEYYNLLKEEIDFIRETENMIKFKDMFADTKWIKIPAVYREICTNDFIIMEYVPAIKMDDIEKMKEMNFNQKKIASKLIDCYINQIIDHGFIHVDPHFSNIKITESGQIVFYDFGMVVKLDDGIKLYFNDLLVALYNKDIDAITKILIKLDVIIVEPDKIAYFKKFIIFFLSYIEKMKIDEFKLTYLDSLNKTAMPFLISNKYILLLRGLAILEGNCKFLDPTFNYKNTLDPYIDKYLININYLENKMIDDINMLQTYPLKITEQEINLEIMRMNTQYDTNAKDSLIKKKGAVLGSVLLVMAILENDIAVPIFIGLLSIIILF